MSRDAHHVSAGGYERELAFAHDLADLADDLTLPAFRAFAAGEGSEVERKSDDTEVTAVDRDVERRLRLAVTDRFPEHAVLGEEGGLDGPDDAPCWIIDPIDGTRNFIRGNPVFATLIALRLDEDEVLGVVSAPALATRWDGRRGGPARQDGREIRVSSTAALVDAEVCLGGLSYFLDGPYDHVPSALARATRRQRGFGDFWQHCLVAAGATDAALEAEVSLWDLAAVRCIVEAAGGRFTTLDGRATADGGDALASNGHLHGALLDLVAGR